MNYKSALMQHMIIDFNQSVFMQDLIIVFSQSFDLDQINLYNPQPWTRQNIMKIMYAK